jgi:hypothetical protein
MVSPRAAVLGIGVLASGAIIASVLHMRKINRYVAINGMKTY